MDEPAKRQKLEDNVEEEVENQEDDGLEGFGDDPDVQALQEADQLQQQLEQVRSRLVQRHSYGCCFSAITAGNVCHLWCLVHLITAMHMF
jgi:hypothetical protein